MQEIHYILIFNFTSTLGIHYLHAYNFTSTLEVHNVTMYDTSFLVYSLKTLVSECRKFIISSYIISPPHWNSFYFLCFPSRSNRNLLTFACKCSCLVVFSFVHIVTELTTRRRYVVYFPQPISVRMLSVIVSHASFVC